MDSSGPPQEEAPRTRKEVKQAVQELLRWGYVESDTKPGMFAAALRLRTEINAALEPLDLELKLDEIRGLAILFVAESAPDDSEEGWGHPLVRRQRLTLEQSLLVAILRQLYLIHEQDVGIGAGPSKVPLEDLLPQLNGFLGDTGSDAKNEQRLLTLIDQLKPHGIVSEPDVNREIAIRPLIAHLANPESLSALLARFREAADVQGGTE